MMRRDRRDRLYNCRAIRVAEVFAAVFPLAAPVFTVACLCAGRRLRFMVLKIMRQRLDLHIFQCDLGLAFRVTEVLAAVLATPIRAVARLFTGSGNSLMGCQSMHRMQNDLILCQFLLTRGVSKLFMASRALPIGNVSVLGAGRFLFIDLFRRVR